MHRKLVRPTPSEKVVDYDDGDPYSCMAAGHAEEKMQRALEERVEQCFGKAAQELTRLAKQDQASVKTALFDIWTRARLAETSPELAHWAAQQLADLGNSSLLEYDKSNPPRSQ